MVTNSSLNHESFKINQESGKISFFKGAKYIAYDLQELFELFEFLFSNRPNKYKSNNDSYNFSGIVTYFTTSCYNKNEIHHFWNKKFFDDTLEWDEKSNLEMCRLVEIQNILASKHFFDYHMKNMVCEINVNDDSIGYIKQKFCKKDVKFVKKYLKNNNFLKSILDYKVNKAKCGYLLKMKYDLDQEFNNFISNLIYTISYFMTRDKKYLYEILKDNDYLSLPTFNSCCYLLKLYSIILVVSNNSEVPVESEIKFIRNALSHGRIEVDFDYDNDQIRWLLFDENKIKTISLTNDEIDKLIDYLYTQIS